MKETILRDLELQILRSASPTAAQNYPGGRVILVRARLLLHESRTLRQSVWILPGAGRSVQG